MENDWNVGYYFVNYLSRGIYCRLFFAGSAYDLVSTNSKQDLCIEAICGKHNAKRGLIFWVCIFKTPRGSEFVQHPFYLYTYRCRPISEEGAYNQNFMF